MRETATSWFRSGAILLTAALAALPADFDLTAALRKVESRYNNIRAMQADFDQTLRYASQPKASRSESGTLVLKRPGKMRWDYQSPAKKLFLSDGKDVYFYSPNMNRVEKSKLKETDDMRAPLAFLIGRLDFARDFREYRTRPEGADHWITAKPKSDKAPYREVQFRLTADFRITQLRVLGQDESIMDYTFRNEKLNPPVDDALFRFQAPAGADVVDLSAAN
jgi:outer membrane lipoprotein carrier protein